MEPREVLTFEQIDLSDNAFWTRPWEEREGAFRLLRREHPLAFFDEPPFPGKLGQVLPKGPGYRAVTRHAHIAEISRHPEIYRSGQGATSILDMPEEMLEYFGSMISTDNPRHAALAPHRVGRLQPPDDQAHRGPHRARRRRRHRPCGRAGRLRFRRGGGGPAPARHHLRNDGHRTGGLRRPFSARPT